MVQCFLMDKGLEEVFLPGINKWAMGAGKDVQPLQLLGPC